MLRWHFELSPCCWQCKTVLLLMWKPGRTDAGVGLGRHHHVASGLKLVLFISFTRLADLILGSQAPVAASNRMAVEEGVSLPLSPHNSRILESIKTITYGLCKENPGFPVRIFLTAG